MRTQNLATTVYLALGSNLGDRPAALGAAVARLAGAAGRIEIAALSPLYETDAVADEPQPPYLNAVLRARTVLSARALLDHALSVERELGRVRPPAARKAPRTIDIDLLLYGALIVDEPGLRLPHPAMWERPFVLIPLADVAERGLRHPVTSVPLDDAAPHPSVRPISCCASSSASATSASRAAPR